MYLLCLENIPASDRDVPVLNLLLKFTTSHLHVPLTGIDQKRVYQMQNSCFNKILLPVKHTNKEEFNNAMMAALQHASCSFASGF